MTLKAQAIQLARTTKNASLKKALATILLDKTADQDDPTYWYGLAPREPAINAPALQPKEAKHKR